ADARPHEPGPHDLRRQVRAVQGCGGSRHERAAAAECWSTKSAKSMKSTRCTRTPVPSTGGERRDQECTARPEWRRERPRPAWVPRCGCWAGAGQGGPGCCPPARCRGTAAPGAGPAPSASGHGPAGDRRRSGGRWAPGRGWRGWGAVVAVLGASVLPVVAGAAGVPLLRRAGLAAAERREGERRADAVIALCGALAGEVRAGRQPGEALLWAARDSGGLGDAHAAVL